LQSPLLLLFFPLPEERWEKLYSHRLQVKVTVPEKKKYETVVLHVAKRVPLEED